MSILGVTHHFRDGNGILRRLFLGLCELNASHTGTAIRRELNKMLAEYGLSIKDVFKVITEVIKEARSVAILAIEVLSIPATSSTIERIFSQAGLTTNGHWKKPHLIS
uniref:HAT C-terminal dimerisation domain-containing protein n=1 Tax=Ditylenchus dipsaci TaxID=166011 RepID=A0A915DCX6_9BILA